jgi:hypothetical protein
MTWRWRSGSRRSSVRRSALIAVSSAAGYHNVVVAQDDLAAAPSPPGHVGVQRRAQHPGPRRRMHAHLAPRHPGPREPLRDKFLGQLPVADVEQHDPQAVITAGFVKLGEFHRRLLHVPVTLSRAASFTRVAAARKRGG